MYYDLLCNGVFIVVFKSNKSDVCQLDDLNISR